MTPELIGVLGFVAMLGLLALRVHVAVAMIAVSVVGNALIVNGSAALARLGSDAFQGASAFNLSVIPLFVFMGLLLAGARLGEDLYAALDVFLWRVRGGLAIATIGASALFGAVSGSAVGSASTMSVVAIPEMRRYQYDEGLSAACTAVGGTLGALIPPSAVLVLYGVLTEEPIGEILIGGIVPGTMTTLMLMATAYLVVRRNPALAPAATEPRARTASALMTIARIWSVPVIFGVSMGGIYLGVFTPTEAGAVGAFLSLLYGIVTRRLDLEAFRDAVSRTVRISAMIFFVVIAGKMFGFFLSATRIPRGLGDFVTGLDLQPWLVVTVIFLMYFALGALMDEIAILVIMTPIMYPVIIALGYDGVWFGVLTIMMLLTGLLTPPVGLIVFVVSGITRIPVGHIFRRVAPFWVALSVAIMLTIIFPDIILLLPELMR